MLAPTRRVDAEWYEQARDGTVVKSERFVAGGEAEIPTPYTAEVTVGAKVEMQKNTLADGSVTVKAQINGSLGTEVANALGLKINGSLSTDYKFDNEEQAEQFINALSDAANDKVSFTLDSPFLVDVGPGRAVTDVIRRYETNHNAYKGSLELEASLETGVGGHKIDVSGAAGAERNFTNGATTFYAKVSGSTGIDLGLDQKFGLKGDTQIRVTVDGNGNASELTIVGSVSGSAPVRGVIDSLAAANGTDYEMNNVIPGNRNKETVAANVTITLDVSDPENPAAVADLINALIGTGDQSLGNAAADLLDRAEVKVGVTTTKSGVLSADVDVVEFEIGNSEVTTVASFGKSPNGDFQRLS
jgi:hypothetical protein